MLQYYSDAALTVGHALLFFPLSTINVERLKKADPNKTKEWISFSE